MHIHPILKITGGLSTPKRGASPNYSDFHVIMAFFNIGKNPLGRKTLGELLGIGEGTARTMIEKLQDIGLVKASPTGCYLTKKGNKRLEELKKRVSHHPKVDVGYITLGRENSAVIVRDAAHKIKSGMTQRDAAISAGAIGASTLILDETGPRIPMINADENMQARMKMLCEDMKMKKGDVLIIGTGDSEREAERAAWAAACTILEEC
ncbi:MAG: hypothetical protein PHY36_03480 [Methanocellales archaeon]|nr:hypothetical protein [Methanocellales archaeon]MDD5446927.1 hypothetical protein [Methanocellales archaeon]